MSRPTPKVRTSAHSTRVIAALLAVFLAGVFLPSIAAAQGLLVDTRPGHAIRLPRPIPIPRPVPEGVYRIESLEVNAKLTDQVARVQVSQTFVNTGSRQMEVCFVFPLPYDGAVDQLTLMVDGKEYDARLLAADEARRIYESIVRKNQDPALLEWVGTGMFRTSVFPVPPGAKRTVTLRYTQVCRMAQGLTDFVFPLSTAKYTSKAIEKLSIRVAIDSGVPIKNVYSPSHGVAVQRPTDKQAVVSMETTNTIPTSDFRLLYGIGTEHVGASLLSYRPAPGDDGYFLLLASPRIDDAMAKAQPKTVLFVVDRSGSMSGKKIEQAKGALRFVLNNLNEGDLFNMIAYDSEIGAFKPELQRYTDDTRAAALGFVEGLYAGGSTNIDGALRRAMSMLVDSSRPNYVIFLTDGLPTAGETGEAKIVGNSKSVNQVRARLFAFGVGYDVNSRLLDKLVRTNFGQSEYVRPSEDIEAAVSKLYRRIGAPVLTNVAIRFDVEGARVEQGPPVHRIYPQETLDLFAGEQLVLVGRYKVSGDAKVVITGTVGGKEQRFDFPAKLVADSPDSTNGFVAKLWATRRAGEIIDKLDLEGQNAELVKELVALATEHGILTPYTSFLADETSDLRDVAANVRLSGRMAARELAEVSGARAFGGRGGGKGSLQRARQPTASGDAAVPAAAGGAYGFGDRAGGRGLGRGYGGGMGGSGDRPGLGRGGGGMGGYGRGQALVGKAAVAFDLDHGAHRNVTTVQLIGRKTFFFRDGCWVDASLTEEEEKNAEKIERFSDAYFALNRNLGRDVGKYQALDEPVVVKLNGKVYRW